MIKWILLLLSYLLVSPAFGASPTGVVNPFHYAPVDSNGLQFGADGPAVRLGGVAGIDSLGIVSLGTSQSVLGPNIEPNSINQNTYLGQPYSPGPGGLWLQGAGFQMMGTVYGNRIPFNINMNDGTGVLDPRTVVGSPNLGDPWVRRFGYGADDNIATAVFIRGPSPVASVPGVTFSGVAAPVSLVPSAAAAANQATVSFSSTTGIINNMLAEGPNVPIGTVVASHDATSVTLSNNLTGAGIPAAYLSANYHITFGSGKWAAASKATPSGTTLYFASTAGMYQGENVDCPNVPVATTIAQPPAADSILLSASVTGSGVVAGARCFIGGSLVRFPAATAHNVSSATHVADTTLALSGVTDLVPFESVSGPGTPPMTQVRFPHSSSFVAPGIKALHPNIPTTATVSSATATTVTLSANTTSTGVASGDSVCFSITIYYCLKTSALTASGNNVLHFSGGTVELNSGGTYGNMGLTIASNSGTAFNFGGPLVAEQVARLRPSMWVRTNNDFEGMLVDWDPNGTWIVVDTWTRNTLTAAGPGVLPSAYDSLSSYTVMINVGTGVWDSYWGARTDYNDVAGSSVLGEWIAANDKPIQPTFDNYAVIGDTPIVGGISLETNGSKFLGFGIWEHPLPGTSSYFYRGYVGESGLQCVYCVIPAGPGLDTVIGAAFLSEQRSGQVLVNRPLNEAANNQAISLLLDAGGNAYFGSQGAIDVGATRHMGWWTQGSATQSGSDPQVQFQVSGGTQGVVNSGSLQIGAAQVSVTGKLVVSASTPASASAACTAGTITWDASFEYVCIATDTWKRAALSTW